VRDGIAILLPPGFDEGAVHDEIDHAHAHKRQQADHYDRTTAEAFEISRPHGAPSAYRALMREKFVRSIERLPDLRGATVLAACCGSGMDAEMLARRGAGVIAIDVSEGCVRRARARAETYGVDYLALVGDIERLPLRSRSIDISYVHDGLHHLEDPARGLWELARVARRAVSVTEPADAFGTAVAVRLGLALAREEAGNRVARLRADDALAAFSGAGFDASARRYLMHYGHEPGTAMRAMSRPLVHPMYRAGRRAANLLAGRWGNKLQVTAIRRAA
jgi:SAM-dependent methyltransferase